MYSKKITHPRKRLVLPLEIRYLRIPVNWSVEEIPASERQLSDKRQDIYPREHFLGFEDGWGTKDQRGKKIPAFKDDSPDWRYRLVPEVKSEDCHPTEANPFELRSRFLKLNIDSEEDTLGFLNDVGVWDINEETGDDSTRIDRAVGQREVLGYASTFPVGELRRAQKRVKLQLAALKKNPDQLRAYFGPPPQPRTREHREHSRRNRLLNTLPLHMEWREGQPQGVTQLVTGHEMLNATLQLDLLRGDPVQTCKRCGNAFTGRVRKFCTLRCARAENQARYRARLQAKKTKTKGWKPYGKK